MDIQAALAQLRAIEKQASPVPWRRIGVLEEADKISGVYASDQEVNPILVALGTLPDTMQANAQLATLAPLAGDAIAALEHRRMREEGEDPPPYGHDCLWCGDCMDKLEAEEEAVLDTFAAHMEELTS